MTSAAPRIVKQKKAARARRAKRQQERHQDRLLAEARARRREAMAMLAIQRPQ